MSEEQSPYRVSPEGQAVTRKLDLDGLVKKGLADPDFARAYVEGLHEEVRAVCEENAKLRSQAEKLREALEPLIADVTDDWSGAPDDATVDLFATVGQCRAARAAYEETSDPVCKESLHGDNTSKSVDQQSEIGDAQPVNRILHDTEGKPE